MKRDRLFGNVLMRLAAYVAMAFACVGSASAWGLSTAPINPAFKQWQKERRQKSDSGQSITNSVSRSRRRLASGEGEGELGFAPGTFDSSYLSSINVNSQQGVQGGFASRYDLREHSILTTIKNQNPYGTCWAHATCASLESWLLKSGVGTFDFSENNMANLHGGDWGFDDGGNGDRASAYLLRWGGPVLESEDPYPNWGGSTEKAPSRHVQNVRWIPGRTSYLDNDAIKQAIIDFGATYVTYYHSSSYYKSSTASYYFYGNTSRNSNHAVAIVGWDDDYPASKFAKAPPGNGAFIVRNSWGANWGEGGYFYVSYYDESFAWTTLYSFSNAESTDNYESIYEYDPLGLVKSLGYGSATAWGANMFQATAATKISAVGFYAMTPNTTYTIYVYTGSTASSPRSGTLATTQSGKAEYAGYVTVPLTSPVSVSARQLFSVAVQLTTPGYNYPLACEYAYPGYTSEATAASGQSFLSSNGSSWSDFTSWKGSANFCCKAYTKSAPPPKPTLTSLAISGVMSLTSGQSAQFTCEAMYLDESRKDVTSSCSWSIARDSQSYATVSSTGLVTAKTVSKQETVTVQASYTEDGVTKAATWGMYVTIAAPSAPTGVTATQGTEPSCVRVNWTAPSGATEYAVYRATANNSRNAQYLENVTVAKYNDTSAIPGVDYWYFIKAKNSSGTSGFSTGANGWRKLAPPESVTASDTLLDKVALEWSEVEGATHYRVYRAESMDGEKTALGNWQSATTFNDTTATAGVTYFYFVVAAVDASGNRPSDYSLFDDGIRPEPITIDHLEIKGDASIAAGSFADYAADAIYTDGHKVENITPDSWEVVGNGASVVGGRVSAVAVTENKTVTLVATYTEDGKTVTGEKSITIAAVKPVAPRNVAAVAAAQGVTLSWNAVAGAASYAIYRDGTAVGRVVPNAPGDVPATIYTDSSAIPGVTYSYTVSAANGAGEGPQSSPAVTATIPLPAPTGVTATTDRTDGVLVDWRRVMDNAPYHGRAGCPQPAVYFRVARAMSEDGAKTELGTWTTDTSFLDTSAPVDTPLWYFVRAATSADGANASDWSGGVVGRVVPNAPQLLSIVISGPDKVASSGSAVYSCTAAYDDGTIASIAPSWSASGAAAIDANGKLTAQAVTADATVTVTAAFGGKSATKDVKVLAPVQASASVSNVRVKPRWPFSTLVDIDYTLATSPEGTRALVTLSGQDNDHNVPLAAKTLTGDAVGAAIAAGDHRLTWDIGADYPGFHTTSFDVNLEAVPYTIAAPANVSASQGTSTRGVNLSWNAVEDATGYEIWRASGSMNTADAVLVTNVEAVVAYEDTAVNPGDIYFYWFKTVTQYGTGDFSASVFGYRARVVGTVAFDANGGTASASSLGYTAGSPYGTLPTASRTGYEFAGWFTSATGGSEVTAATPADENIATLYAHWTPHTYTIHFDPNGGCGTMSDMSLTYGIATNLTPNVFVKAAYMFAGWTTNLNQICYEDGASVINLSANHEDIVVLCAMWSPAAPSDVNASDAISTDFISVSWSPVVDAIAYEIWRHDEDGNNVTNIANVVALGYEDTSATPGQSYYYSVRAVFQNSVGELSAEDVGCRKLQTPSLSASQGDDWNRVVLTTGELPIGTPLTVRVEIWRSESPSISSAEEIGTVSGGQRYYDSNVIAGNNYYYWTRLYYGANDVSKSDFSPCVVGYASEVSSVYISGAETLTPDGQACYRLMATCNDGAVRVFPGTVSYGFQDRYGIVNFRSKFMTPGDWSLESSSYLMWLTITNADITASRTITLTATSSYKDVTRTVSKSVTIKPKPNNFPYRYAVSSSGLVALTGYSGTDSIITVPSQINGMTVVELASTFRSDKVGIKSVSLPSSLQIIGGRAFYLCKSLTSISIPSSVTTISGSAFTGTALISITIPSTVTSISEAAFDYACRLQSINVDSRNPKYSSSSGVLFNKDMTTLIAYPPAKSDKTYNIPDGVTYISSYSSGFHACFNLTSITLPNSLTGIYTGQVFQNCDALASIQVNEGNPSFCSSEGVLYSKNMDKLIKYPNAKKSTTFVVPPSVGIIDGCAFNCATNLCQLVIPASVTNCCGIAGCEALTAIYCFGDFPFTSPLFGIYNSNVELDARQSYGALYKCSWAISRNIPTYYFPETLNWGTASYLNEWNNPLVSLEISGPSTINANSSNKYIGLGTFSSGHTGVGCKVSWMITEGAEYASISADGVVATGAVDATQIVKIKATTTLGGVTRNATKTVTLKP